jgi:PmbA protein
MALSATDLAQSLLGLATRHGATGADVMVSEGADTALTWLNGRLESFETAENMALGLRVLVGQKQAVAVTTDTSSAALAALAERVCAMAKAAPDDPFARLSTKADWITDTPALDLESKRQPDVATLKERAAALEALMLDVKGVSRSGGSSASAGWGGVTLATSEGFLRTAASTSQGMSVTALSGSGTNMVRESAGHSACHGDDLRPMADLAHEAGERAARLQGATSTRGGPMPIVFDRRVAATLVRHFLNAISGDGVANGTSFLKDALNTPIFGPALTLIDDPRRVRGLASRPFDAEGLATRTRTLVDRGVLTGWLLDLSSAARLNLPSTGNAGRGPGSLPSPTATNVHVVPGTATPDTLMADIARGFYVTGLIGHGVNGITGDYSRGATGFLIENGKLTRPVQEVTIAGNLKEMFRQMMPANDLFFHGTVNSPTLRVDGMTLGGK